MRYQISGKQIDIGAVSYTHLDVYKRQEHFRLFHPGGKLGAKLLKVRDLMHSDLPLISQDSPMSEALLVISQRGFGVVGVTDAQGLVGIITDGDLRRNMDGLLRLTAGQVMTLSLIHI